MSVCLPAAGRPKLAPTGGMATFPEALPDSPVLSRALCSHPSRHLSRGVRCTFICAFIGLTQGSQTQTPTGAG